MGTEFDLMIFGGLSMNKWFSTNFPGVRYREHATRKHGVAADRYFAIRAQVAGRRHEEGLGWASEGWSAKKASLILADLKKAHITGEGPRSLSEKREIENQKREAEAAIQEEQKKDALTVAEFVERDYFPQAERDKKPNTVRSERMLYKIWLAPVIGDKPIRSVTSFNVEKIKRNMADAGKAARTIELALALTRQIFNHARRAGLWQGDGPTSSVKKPKVNNGRMRYLTKGEAQTLLEALRERSHDTHDAALLSLHCGLRQGEIFALRWSDVDLERNLLSIRDAKAGDRTAFLTEQAAEVLKVRGAGAPSELVFQQKSGQQKDGISKTFARTVEDLGLNAGVDDRRQRIVFHSCRHSYASWLVEEGVDLYTVQRLLGHKTGVMTQRYAHLNPDTMRNAVAKLETALERPVCTPPNQAGLILAT